MNYKQIIALIVILVGVVLLGFGFYGKHRIDQARGRIDTASKFIPEKRVKSIFSGELHGEVDQYVIPVILCFIGGAVLVLGGGYAYYYFRNKE